MGREGAKLGSQGSGRRRRMGIGGSIVVGRGWGAKEPVWSKMFMKGRVDREERREEDYGMFRALVCSSGSSSPQQYMILGPPLCIYLMQVRDHSPAVTPLPHPVESPPPADGSRHPLVSTSSSS